MASVMVVVMSTETTNPMNEGAELGIEEIGDELGRFEGEDVMNKSQHTYYIIAHKHHYSLFT